MRSAPWLNRISWPRMSAATIASTVESISRSRNSLVERSSVSSARCSVTSRKVRVTAPLAASTVEVDTATHAGAVDEQDAALLVQDHHAVVGGVEMGAQGLDAAQPALRLEAGARDAVG